MSTDPTAPADPPDSGMQRSGRSAPPGEAPEPDCAEVLDALLLARVARDFDAPELKAAVAACAARYRAAGMGPERLLVRLKGRVRETALPDMGEWYRTVLTDRIVVWAIEAYYGITEP